jgi:hypothetical protein
MEEMKVEMKREGEEHDLFSSPIFKKYQKSLRKQAV